MITRTLMLGSGCALALLCTAALAADPPDAGAGQRLEREQLERLLQEQRLRKMPEKPEIALPEAAKPAPVSQAKNIPVKGFQVDDSAILSKEAIQGVLGPYEGQTLSLADLFEAVAAINKLYDEKQMPTARAFLPPQEIKDGMVRIRLVEARVGEIQLNELTQVSPGFVHSRMSLEKGELMSVPQLEQDLLRFNRLHEVQLRASVQAGKDVGTTDVQLQAAEPKRDQFSVFADNAGRYTVGEYRAGFTARRTGLTGRGDSLLFSAAFSEGSDSYYLGYSLPLTPEDLRLDVSYSRGGIDVVEGNFVPLDVSGQSQDLTLGLTKPLVVEAARMWNLYGRFSAKESISEFGGVTQQDVDLAVFSVGVSGEHQTESSAWTIDANLNQGVTALGGESRFTALRANVAWLGRYTPRTQFLLRGGLQYSPTALVPSSEQFQLGGSASVRGYSEGLLSGRNGYLMSAELRYALQDPEQYLTRDPNAPLLTGVVFLDHGGAIPYRPPPLKNYTNDDFLTGAGFGVVMDWKSRLTGRLAVAWPLNKNPGETQQREPRLHASIAYNW